MESYLQKVPTVDKCCCCTLRTGCLVLAWLLTIGSALSIIGCIVQISHMSNNIDVARVLGVNPQLISNEESSRIQFIVLLIMAIIYLPVGILFILGINKSVPKYFVPYLVICIISLFYTVLSIIFNIIRGQFGLIFGNLAGLALNIYFFVVVYSYYKIVQQETTNNGVAYQQPTEAGYPLAAGTGDYNQPGYPGGNNQAVYPLAVSPEGKIQPGSGYIAPSAPTDGVKPTY